MSTSMETVHGYVIVLLQVRGIVESVSSNLDKIAQGDPASTV